VAATYCFDYRVVLCSPLAEYSRVHHCTRLPTRPPSANLDRTHVFSTLVLITNFRPSFEIFYIWPHGLVVSPLRCRVGLFSSEGRLTEIVICRSGRITMTSNMRLSLNLLLVLVTEGKVIAAWIRLESTPNGRCRMTGTTV
jgi:hypothetical protein